MCARGNCLGQIPSKTNPNDRRRWVNERCESTGWEFAWFCDEDEGETGVQLHNTTHLEREKVDPDQIVEL